MTQESLPISAVIPTYNSTHFSEETVLSLLQQTTALNEIIIVDDNSNDGTQTLLNGLQQTYSQKLKLHFLPENVGSSEARNVGLRLAKEPWVLLMDHDDLAEPDLVKAEWARLQELEAGHSGKWVLVHSAAVQIMENDAELPGIHSWRQVEPEEILGYELLRNRILSNSGVLLNRELALQAGGYDRSLKYSQDWDLWIRLAQVGGFGYVDRPLVKIRRYSGNTSKTISGFQEDERKVLAKYDLAFIKTAIYRRQVPKETNHSDFTSMLYRLGEWETGLATINRVLQSKPDFASGYYLKALYYLKHHAWEQAEQSLESAFELAPENGAVLNNLAALKAAKGDVLQAKFLLKRAIKLFPGYLDATSNLNQLTERNGLSMQEAKFTWRELRPVLLSYSK